MSSRERLWTMDFFLIIAIAILMNVLTQGINNGLPIFIDNQGGEAAFSGLLILEFSIVAAVARLLSGYFVDNGSRQKIMIIGGSMYLIGVAGSLIFPGLEPLFVFRFLQGIGMGSIATAAATSATDIVPPSRISESIGYYSLGQSIGMAIGPALGVTLVLLPDITLFFVGFAIAAAIQLILILFCRYEKNPEKLPESCAYLARLNEQKAAARPKEKTTFKKLLGIFTNLFEPHALVGAIPMLVYVCAISIIMNFTSLYASQQGIEAPGAFFVCAAIVMTLLRLLGSRLFDLFAPIKMFLFPVGFGILTFILLLNAHSLFVLCLSGAAFGLSMGMALPILSSVAIKNTPSDRWGAANGLFFLFVDFGIGIGSLAWGRVIDVLGFPATITGGAIFVVLSYIVALIMFPKQPNKAAEE